MSVNFQFRSEHLFWWNVSFRYTSADKNTPGLIDVDILVQYERIPREEAINALGGVDDEYDETSDESRTDWIARRNERIDGFLRRVVKDIEGVEGMPNETFSAMFERMLQEVHIRQALIDGYMDAVIHGRAANDAADKSSGDAN